MTHKFLKTSLLLGLSLFTFSTTVTVSANTVHKKTNVHTHKVVKKHKKSKSKKKHTKKTVHHKKVTKKHIKKTNKKKHKKIIKKRVKKKIIKKRVKQKKKITAEDVFMQHVNHKEKGVPAIIPATTNFNIVMPSTDGTLINFNDYINVQYRVGNATTNYLPMLSGYKDALNYVYGASNANYQDALQKMQSYSDNNKDAWKTIQNNFVVSQSDENHIVDVYHLSQADKQNITVWTSQVYNSIRSQLGNYTTIPSFSTQSFADKIADVYSRDNWNIFDKNNHDVKGINDIARSLGYTADPTNTYQMYENYGAWKVAQDDNFLSHASIGAVKFYIWKIITSMMYDDGGSVAWGHAISIAGIRDMTNPIADGLGVSFDNLGQIHFVQVASSNVPQSTWNNIVNSKMN